MAAICGLQVGRGGRGAWNKATAAYETIGCLSEIGLNDPIEYVAGVFEEHFAATGQSYAESVVGATNSKGKKPKTKVTKKGVPAAAKGRREGNVW